MQRWKIILYNTGFALNCLLVFLLVFEDRLTVPAWLQSVGRMHPLLLHFPIVLMVLCILLEMFSGIKKSVTPEQAAFNDWLLLFASLTAVGSAIMGLFLSKEEGYSQHTVAWHKWGGVFFSLLSFAWYALRHYLRRQKIVQTITAISTIVIVAITGHLGANITHGENFLSAPFMNDEKAPTVLLEDAVAFTHLVQPILTAKCISCHNQNKAKGQLVMEPATQLLKGGKNGILWDSSAADFGLLMNRLHLPLSSKEHMPPAGKPQLTADEISIIQLWLRSGASITAKISELPETDSLRMLATSMFATVETDNYTFEAADDGKIKSMNNNYRRVAPLATGSPALGIEFFGAAQFTSEQLKDLLAVRQQVVSLNLNKMPVGEDDLTTIAQFVNLRRLNLSFTDIKGDHLAILNSLKELRQLSLSGTGVRASQVMALGSLPELKQLQLWNTPAQMEELATLQKKFKNTTIETGFSGDTILVKLNPPVIENEESVFANPLPLHLKHYVKGVTMRYTVDGTEPDSLNSPIFKNDVVIDKTLTLKTKAFKPGWVSSDIKEKVFYKAGFLPDSSWLLHPGEPKYSATGAATLTDAKKGDPSFRFANWLGYQNNVLEGVFYYRQPATVSSVTVSSFVNIYNHILPPKQIELWAGKDPSHLRLLKKIVPEQPLKYGSDGLKNYELSFSPVTENYFKLVIKPVGKVGKWLDAKGPLGYLFVDEIFLN